MHEVLVNRLGGLSLPRKSVVRLPDRPDLTLDVYRGRKTTMQQQQIIHQCKCQCQGNATLFEYIPTDKLIDITTSVSLSNVVLSMMQSWANNCCNNCDKYYLHKPLFALCFFSSLSFFIFLFSFLFFLKTVINSSNSITHFLYSRTISVSLLKLQLYISYHSSNN